jgi:hypothetical protein
MIQTLAELFSQETFGWVFVWTQIVVLYGFFITILSHIKRR